MNISSVSFAGTTPTSFQDMIQRPQAYVRTETPAASTSIKSEGKSHKGLKVAAGIVLGAAAIAAGLAAGNKFHIFDKIPQENIKNGLNKAGKFIIDKAGAITGKVMTGVEWVKSHLPKFGEKAKEAAQDMPVQA